MKIYHTETQADYDALMVELEMRGCKWASGRKPTESKDWVDHKEKTGVVIEKRITRAYIGKLKFEYPNIPIVKYKAKADEEMRFNKQNIERAFDKFMQGGDTFADLKERIMNLVDEPEKVVVPKIVAEFYDGIRDDILYEKIKAFETATHEDVSKWYMDFKGRHNNNRANAQETIAKMDLYGYTIEPEKLYYIPLPHLKTSDGIQQVLSKRENGTNYFASRPNENLKQRFTKDELAQVPVSYKPYAKPIEEEEE